MSHNRPCKTNKWVVPPAGFFKINVDGATSEDGRNSSVRAIIRDFKGRIVVTSSKYLSSHFSVLEVETIVVECGILLAREMELPLIIIEIDAIAVVQGIEAVGSDGYLGHLYQGIGYLLKSFRNWKIKHLKRDYNKVAHELAQCARRSEETQVWNWGSARPLCTISL